MKTSSSKTSEIEKAEASTDDKKASKETSRIIIRMQTNLIRN
ncbi:MAG: hypothetical protein ACLSA2_06530 [Candidatus Gastranaerophilaceae bacterium]